MAVVLNAQLREERGSHAVKRLRRNGLIPAILYGHGQPNVNLALPGDELHRIVQHGTKLVELRGPLSESALIRDVQWDTYGNRVLHVDFVRVSAGERVTTKIAVMLRGEAPGGKAGGLIEHVLHEVEIECPVSSLPDRLEVSISRLGLGESIHAREIPLPEGATLLEEPESVVVHCVEAVGAEAELAAAPEAGEPEVIGRKAEGEGEEEE